MRRIGLLALAVVMTTVPEHASASDDRYVASAPYDHAVAVANCEGVLGIAPPVATCTRRATANAQTGTMLVEGSISPLLESPFQLGKVEALTFLFAHHDLPEAAARLSYVAVVRVDELAVARSALVRITLNVTPEPECDCSAHSLIIAEPGATEIRIAAHVEREDGEPIPAGRVRLRVGVHGSAYDDGSGQTSSFNASTALLGIAQVA